MAMFRSKRRMGRMRPEKPEEAEDNPPDYEGPEHVRYKEPVKSKHNVRFPEDEPHMKSRVSKEESHEMEDNYHMGVPDESQELPKKILRARMKMDEDQGPKPLVGNLVTTTGKGIKDRDGWEEYGPNEMQQDTLPKANRKKMIAAVIKKKMKKQDETDREDESEGERKSMKKNKMFSGSRPYSTVRNSFK